MTTTSETAPVNLQTLRTDFLALPEQIHDSVLAIRRAEGRADIFNLDYKSAYIGQPNFDENPESYGNLETIDAATQLRLARIGVSTLHGLKIREETAKLSQLGENWHLMQDPLLGELVCARARRSKAAESAITLKMRTDQRGDIAARHPNIAVGRITKTPYNHLSPSFLLRFLPEKPSYRSSIRRPKSSYYDIAAVNPRTGEVLVDVEFL
jgi:hypothetical protein